MDKLELRDIHLPTAIGWWPPAIGWWLLPVLIAVALVGAYWLYRRLTRDSAVKVARRLLKDIKQKHGDDALACTGELSALLRRVAVCGKRRSQVARLYGEDWLRFLDQGLADAPFTTGVGRILADAHFRPTLSADVDLDALFALCERWLKQQESAKC